MALPYHFAFVIDLTFFISECFQRYSHCPMIKRCGTEGRLSLDKLRELNQE
jgi:hypothetical protein